MTSDKSRRVEVRDEDQTVAAAEVTPVDNSRETARTSLHPSSGPARTGSRAILVDAVTDTPEVQNSARLEAAVPLGDAESLQRLRERTDETVTRPAGSTVLVDGGIPPVSHDEPGQEPAGEASGS